MDVQLGLVLQHPMRAFEPRPERDADFRVSSTFGTYTVLNGDAV